MSFDVDPDLLVKGPSTSDMEVITTPYENHEASSKTLKCNNDHGLLRKRRRNSHPASDLFEFKHYYRETRLREAAAVNNTENIERILLNYQVNPNAADAQGRTALHIAASRGFVDAVTCLIKAGANVNAEDKLGNTPMHLAVYTGSAPTVCALIRGGAHLRNTAALQYTPLQLAESKYTMLINHKSVFCHRKDTQEIVNILRLMADSNATKLQELDELAGKVSQMGFKEPDEDFDEKP